VFEGDHSGPLLIRSWSTDPRYHRGVKETL
jgi:hypothetical protein